MRRSLRVLALAAAACCLAAAAARAADQRPNVLFIMTDDHAAHAMSCYGSRINQTPNLDRLARQGMRFTNCFCTNSICGPSRAVILTGKYSHLNGFWDNNRSRFDGSQTTVAKLLQQGGYQTAMIGKWHLVTDPTGFDYWNILPGQGVYHNPAMIEMGKRTKHEGYVTDIISDFTLDFLNRRDPQRPFFAMYHHKAPHRPWEPDAKHAKLYEDVEIPEPETFNDDYATRGRAAREQTMSIERDLNRTDLKMDPPPGLEGQTLKKWKYQRYIKDYLRCVAAVDDNVGRVLDYLDRSGLAENTIVVYTSDQGFYLGDHGWYDKRFIYEFSLRMPLLVRWPGKIKPGSVCDKIVLNLDFAPTFLDCAGLPAAAEMQGRSFRGLLEGTAPTDWRTAMYYRYYEFPQPHHVQPHYGVRTERHKLAYFHQVDEWELYDLAKDPNELNNVYADPAYAATVRELKAELARLKQHYRDDDTIRGEKP
jgi:arylsulfatase A-like enzyme